MDFARMKAGLVGQSRPPNSQHAHSVSQSIRHLPVDLESDLRNACSLVVGNSPAAAEAAATTTTTTTRSSQPTTGRRKRTCTTVETRPPVMQKRSPGLDNHPVKIAQQQSRHDSAQNATDRSDALRLIEKAHSNNADGSVAARVGEVTSGVAIEESRPTHVRSKSSSAYLSVSIPRFMRPAIAHRGSSMETTRSAYQSDITDDNAMSTAVTSVGISPAQVSKRTSARAGHDQEQLTFRPDSQDLEAIKKKLEVNRSTREEEPDGHSVLLRKLSMPSRKPVRPGKQAANSVENLFHAHAADLETAKTRKPAQQSKDGERQGRSTVRARAASSARSLSRGLKELLRPSSQQASDPVRIWRVSRPFTSRGEEPHKSRDTEWTRRGWRASVDSLLPPVLTRVQTDNTLSPKLAPRRFSQQVLGGLSRPMSSHGSKNTAVAVISDRARQNDQEAIDLNRQLPPLPKLDSWKDEETEVVLPEVLPANESFRDHAYQRKRRIDSFEPVVMNREGFENDGPVSPITLMQHIGSSSLTAPSPRPEMSATFCPGEFEFYEPMRTPSSISESSIRALEHIHDVRVALPRLDIEAASPDSEHGEMSPEAPRVARLVSRVSNGNLKAQLVDNTASNRVQVRPSAVMATPSQQDSHLGLPPPSQDLPLGSTSSAHDGRVYPDILGSNRDPHAKPVILLRKQTKKSWWRAAAKYKQRDWMSDVEQSGSRSGMLMLDEAAAAPIVRYS